MLRGLGIAVAREGIPWPLVERDGQYDFSALDPFIAAMNRHQILPIWDLCHYGYPDDADPFDAGFHRALRRLLPGGSGIRGAPGARTALLHADQRDHVLRLHGRGMGLGGALTATRTRIGTRCASPCVRPTSRRVKAIREVDPEARMVHIDPLIQVVRRGTGRTWPRRPSKRRYEDTFLAWDVIAGKRHPELGGSPEILDIVRRQLLFVRPDGVPRARSARRAAARRRPHRAAGRAAAPRSGSATAGR